MNIAIILLNWNDWRNTIDCLESIYQNDSEFDVFLVDNGSEFRHNLNIFKWYRGHIISNRVFIKSRAKKKGKLIQINPKNNIFNEKKNQKNLYFIRNKQNFGLTKGLNIGYEFAIRNNYDLLLRVDNDFILSKNYISKIVSSIKSQSIVGASPKILHAYLKKSVWYSGFKMSWSYLKFQRTMNLKKKRRYDNCELNKVIETDMVSGCCSIYKASVLKKTGLGDEDFFYGPEDFELSHRLKKYGKLICDQRVITYHKIGKSSLIAKEFDRSFQSNLGFLILIKKIGTLSDKLFGYSFFIFRGIYYFFFLKNYEKKKGYYKALKFFFKKDEK